jgi:thioredoxin reductase (NADPH)
MEEKTFDTVIVGSGPAGLTAAIYVKRAGFEPIVIAGDMPGGQLTITTTVDNWPGFPNGTGGIKLMMDMQAQVKNLGVEIKYGLVHQVNKVNQVFKVQLDDGKTVETRSIIVATGARAKWLGLPNEKELIGKGISGCATCDGMFFRGKTVAVVGGGAVACEDASFLAKLATKVYLIHRRDTLRATQAEANLVLKDERIEKVWNTEITEIVGKLKVESLKVKNNKTGDESILPVDGLFVAVGRAPATGFLKGVVELKENGYIVTGKDQTYASMTTSSGIFAAGDCMDEVYRQAIVAAGSGAKAAIDAEKWLKCN